MEKDGVRLYGEADKMDVTIGSLLSCYMPPNRECVAPAYKALSLVIDSLQEFMLNTVERTYPQGARGSEEQKRYNYTRTMIKKLARKYKVEMRDRLKANVWRG